LSTFFSLRKNQAHLRKFWKLDVFYALVNSLITKAGIAIILVATVIAGETLIPQTFRNNVAAMPLWIQVPVAVVLSDIGFYIVHRTFHKVPWLWKFHAIHHSIEELDWLAAHRVHPFDQICTKGASLLPLLLLGISNTAFAIYATLYYWQSLLIHSNVRLTIGPLRWLIATPQFHHWHHANEKRAYDKNFSGQLSIIDYLMGTLILPQSNYPNAYGTNEPVPTQYIGQLTFPLNAAGRPTPPPDRRDPVQ
jgi:sterol desaturase/sphingolipid hydroxylase (fatty acid hydroxylase superfamily)